MLGIWWNVKTVMHCNLLPPSWTLLLSGKQSKFLYTSMICKKLYSYDLFRVKLIGTDTYHDSKFYKITSLPQCCQKNFENGRQSVVEERIKLNMCIKNCHFV